MKIKKFNIVFLALMLCSINVVEGMEDDTAFVFKEGPDLDGAIENNFEETNDRIEKSKFESFSNEVLENIFQQLLTSYIPGPEDNLAQTLENTSAQLKALSLINRKFNALADNKNIKFYFEYLITTKVLRNCSEACRFGLLEYACQRNNYRIISLIILSLLDVQSKGEFIEKWLLLYSLYKKNALVIEVDSHKHYLVKILSWAINDRKSLEMMLELDTAIRKIDNMGLHRRVESLVNIKSLVKHSFLNGNADGLRFLVRYVQNNKISSFSIRHMLVPFSNFGSKLRYKKLIGLAFGGDIESLEALLEQISDQQTARVHILLWAIAGNQKELVTKMLEELPPHVVATQVFMQRPSLVNSPPGSLNLNFLKLAMLFKNLDIISLIVSKLKLIGEFYEETLRTSIVFAAKCSTVEVLNYFVNLGESLHMLDNEGNSLLHFASKCGNEEMVNYLASRLDVNLKNQSENTPQDLAHLYGHKNIEEILYINGAENSIKSLQFPPSFQKWYKTDKLRFLLRSAVEKNRILMAKFLLENNITLLDQIANCISKPQKTLLQIAANYGYLDMAKLLLTYGADVHEKNADQQSALYFAIRKSNHSMVKLLLSYDKYNKNVSIDDDTLLMINFGTQEPQLLVGDRILQTKESSGCVLS